MKIDLNLVKHELVRHQKTQAELAKYLGISPPTMVRIFKNNDCTIRQFEKMIEFFGCTGKDMTDFIMFNDSAPHLVSATYGIVSMREYNNGIYDDLSKLRNQLINQDVLRKALVDKDKIIKLLEEKS